MYTVSCIFIIDKMNFFLGGGGICRFLNFAFHVIFTIVFLEGDTCKKDVFGVSTYKSCPEPDDPASYKYCCGPSWGR